MCVCISLLAMFGWLIRLISHFRERNAKLRKAQKLYRTTNKTNHTQHHRQHKPSQDVTPQKWCTSRAFDSQTKTKELLEQNRRSCMNETKKLCPEITTEALDNSEPTDDAILQHHTKRKSERHHRLGNVRQRCNEKQTTKRNKQ